MGLDLLGFEVGQAEESLLAHNSGFAVFGESPGRP
jgi:hypothetical protein